MINKFFLFFLFPLLAFMSCQDADEKQAKRLDNNFSVHGLLDSQIILLEKKSLKKADKNGEEIAIKQPDWTNELQIFRNFDINKSVWQDAFRISRDGNYTIYSSESDKINVKQLKVLYHEGKIAHFSGVYIDENLLYRIEKNAVIKFENGVIKAYRLHGKQKILFADEFEFVIDCYVTEQNASADN